MKNLKLAIYEAWKCGEITINARKEMLTILENDGLDAQIKVRDSDFIFEDAIKYNKSWYFGVNEEEEQGEGYASEPYFKVLYGKESDGNIPIARIYFHKPEFCYHKDRKGHPAWKMNKNKLKEMMRILKRKNNKNGLTYWQTLIVYGNKMILDVVNHTKDLRGRYSEFEMSLDMPMPDYNDVIFDKTEVKNKQWKER